MNCDKTNAVDNDMFRTIVRSVTVYPGHEFVPPKKTLVDQTFLDMRCWGVRLEMSHV